MTGLSMASAVPMTTTVRRAIAHIRLDPTRHGVASANRIAHATTHTVTSAYGLACAFFSASSTSSFDNMTGALPVLIGLKFKRIFTSCEMGKQTGASNGGQGTLNKRTSC